MDIQALNLVLCSVCLGQTPRGVDFASQRRFVVAHVRCDSGCSIACGSRTIASVVKVNYSDMDEVATRWRSCRKPGRCSKWRGPQKCGRLKGQRRESECRVGGSDVDVVSQVRVVIQGGGTGEGAAANLWQRSETKCRVTGAYRIGEI
jgi:hypothetical protein